MYAVPFLVLGGFLLFSKKKRRKKTSAQQVLPPATGDVFVGTGEDRPDLIHIRTGEPFAVDFPRTVGGDLIWKLAASPPDNSIELVGEEEKFLDPTVVQRFTFQGAKPGKGSLVFHNLDQALENKAPPEDIVEILTEVV